MNANIDIVIYEYSDTDIFVVVKRGNDNLYMAMGICQFIDEMAYWGMPTKGGVFNGEPGYIFSESIEIEDIKISICSVFDDIRNTRFQLIQRYSHTRFYDNRLNYNILFQGQILRYGLFGA